MLSIRTKKITLHIHKKLIRWE
ncbi:MAG: hypothetical protein KBF93_00765 [Leptospiraceae bacterium]|nr:hypothetical protein [Leptospiraceae bacterium]